MTDGVSEPVGQVLTDESPNYSWHWLPVDGERHAVRGRPGDHAAGESAPTRCAVSITVPETVDPELWWRWPTCLKCWALSHH